MPCPFFKKLPRRKRRGIKPEIRNKSNLPLVTTQVFRIFQNFEVFP